MLVIPLPREDMLLSLTHISTLNQIPYPAPRRFAAAARQLLVVVVSQAPAGPK